MMMKKKRGMMMKNFYMRDWTLAEKILLTASAALAGLVVGFLWSPVKKGIYCGNHNGNTMVTEEQDL